MILARTLVQQWDKHNRAIPYWLIIGAVLLIVGQLARLGA
jgi:hypothetical protein